MSEYMNDYRNLIAELRGMLPEYMAHKRLVVGGKRGRKINCINPAHADKTPSMSYNEKTKTLHCFGCAVSYDLFDLIKMDYADCDSFPRQVKKACEIFGVQFPDDFGRDTPAASAARTVDPPAVRRRTEPEELPAPEDYTALIERELAEQGAGGAYFAGRGLSPALCAKHKLYERGGRAVLPVFSGGKCTCYCARALRDDVQPRYKNSAGAMDIFGSDYLSGEGRGGVLFVTEAVFDALSAEECGYQAVALCGAGNVRKFLSLCAANPAAANSYTLIAAGDNDAAGERMNAALAEGLRELGISCGMLALPDGAKDLNALLMRDKSALRGALEMAANADSRRYAETSTAHAVGELLDFSIKRATRDAITSGFRGMDDILDGGFYAGLYIIGAISSLGKTSFLLQIADYICAHETDVLFFSLEMGKLELMAKSISRMTYRLDPTAERRDAFTARQVLKFDNKMSAERSILLNKAIGQYKQSGAGMFIREGLADIGVSEIRDAVRAHRQHRGVNPVVIVDYLQILKPFDQRATDKQNTDRNVVELKRISRDFDVPVIAISSFNRENYRNAVSMEAFKESGAVEYSSDVLFGLQLAGAGESGFDVNAAKARSPRAIELVMLKNRTGVPYAKIEYAYHARYNYFVEGARG